jgi:hypothetical protein
MATECAFPNPTNPDHWKVISDCIQDALAEHQADGGLVEEGTMVLFTPLMNTNNPRALGIYPQYESGMIAYVCNLSLCSVLLTSCAQIFADRSTFRSEIKMKAKPIVEHYDRLFPAQLVPGQLEHYSLIMDRVQELLCKSAFLWAEEKDEQVCSRPRPCPIALSLTDARFPGSHQQPHAHGDCRSVSGVSLWTWQVGFIFPGAIREGGPTQISGTHHNNSASLQYDPNNLLTSE